jgi:hypothetical protein
MRACAPLFHQLVCAEEQAKAPVESCVQTCSCKHERDVHHGSEWTLRCPRASHVACERPRNTSA